MPVSQISLDRLKQRMQALVEVESPSDDPAAVNRANDLAEKWALSLGAKSSRHSHPDYGDVLELRFPGAAGRKPVMLLAHLDTVWAMGTLAQMPYREAPDKDGRQRIWGPGTLDMKCGVVMAFEAIENLEENERPPVILLLNPDEEVGSESSRPVTERLAKECCAVFVLEPAQGMSPAAYKTARKGVGNYRVEVKGVASHAGVDFKSGHSAVLELARLLEKIAQFTDLDAGLTVNPGVIGGGTRSNVIAAEAWAEVDIRVVRMADATKLDALFHGLKCEDPACSVTVTGGINRPPMERSEGTVRLFRMAQGFAKELGFDLEEAATGGGSDGNFTAAIGIPTLDGMGAVGEGAHAAHESLLIEHLVPRTELLRKLIAAANETL